MSPHDLLGKTFVKDGKQFPFYLSAGLLNLPIHDEVASATDRYSM
jgi:hypothetical protein